MVPTSEMALNGSATQLAPQAREVGVTTRAGGYALPFVPRNMGEAWDMACKFAKAGLIPEALRNKPEDCLIILLTGAELGLSPMQSFREVYVVKGRGYISALLKVALVKQHPDCAYFKLVESTPERATFETSRKGEGITRLSYTAQEARQAGLLGRQTRSGEPDNWEKYTTTMLRRRCASQLADEVFPDATRGVGTTEEMAEIIEAEKHQLPSAGVKPPPAPAAPAALPSLTRVDTPVVAPRAAEPVQAEAPVQGPEEKPTTPEEVKRVADALTDPAGSLVQRADEVKTAAELDELRVIARGLPKGPGRNAAGEAINRAAARLSGAR